MNSFIEIFYISFTAEKYINSRNEPYIRSLTTTINKYLKREYS